MRHWWSISSSDDEAKDQSEVESEARMIEIVPEEVVEIVKKVLDMKKLEVKRKSFLKSEMGNNAHLVFRLVFH